MMVHRVGMLLQVGGFDLIYHNGAMVLDPSSAYSTFLGADCPRPAPSFVDSIKAKPEEIRVWWRDLTAVFDKSFLALICSVYFLQGCGNLPTLVTKYYIKNSLERTCDEGAVAASATSSGGCGQGCRCER